MSMKKKFLALALAGMVAMPVVASASANGSTTITTPEGTPKTHDVNITGNVDRADGLAQAGTLQVEVPTAMAFTVNKDGVFTAASNYSIYNKSLQPIKVEVAAFRDQSGQDTGIKIIDEASTITSSPYTHKRSEVALALVGANNKKVKLTNNFNADGTNNVLFDRIESNTEQHITLEGVAGKNTTGGTSNGDEVKDGTQDQFVVSFRISKA